MTPLLHVQTPTAGIVGPGRPDQPGTTGLLIDGSETVGTTYTSTDGAGVGAWVWRKRPNGWIVVDGDTGWVKAAVSGGADGHQVYLRRTSTYVRLKGRGTLTVSGYGAQLLTVPVGYRPEIADPTAGGDYHDLTWVQDYTTFKTAFLTKAGVLSLGNGPTANAAFSLNLTWHTAQPWPTSI